MCFLISFLFWSVLMIHWCQWGVKVSFYYCVTVNFSFYICQCLFYVLRCSYVGGIDIYNYYDFLMNWSLGHYVVFFLISCNILYFKVYFAWYEDCYSSFLLLPICMEYIFPYSHFQSLCVFRAYRQHIYGFLIDNIYMGLVFVSIQPVCVFWLEHLICLHLK